MKIYKRRSEKKRFVIMLDKGKLLYMTKKSADDKEIRLSLMHFPKIDENLYVDSFDFDHESGMHAVFDSIFSLHDSGQVCFDTEGAHLTLSRTEGTYSLNFMNEFYEGARAIKTRLVDDSEENHSLNILFDYLVGESKKAVTIVNKENSSIILAKSDMRFEMKLNSSNEAVIDFSHNNKRKKAVAQEVMEITDKDEDIFETIFRVFASYRGLAIFDVCGASLCLVEKDGKYNIKFERRDDTPKLSMYDNTLENKSMFIFIRRLLGLPEIIEKEPEKKKELNQKNVAKP